MKTILSFLIAATLVCGCEKKPLAECEQGLCGHTWALELDSAVAHGEARLQSQPNDENALLDLADAYRQNAWLIKNQTDTRADFWLTSNLAKIEHLLDEGLKLCDKVLQRKQEVARAYQVKGNILRLRMQLCRGTWYISSEDYDNLYGASLSNLEKAIALMPNSADVWYDLALAYREHWYGWRKSAECSKKAIELNPSYKPFALGGAYARDRLKPAQLLSNEIARRRPEMIRLFGEAIVWLDRDGYLEDIRLVPDVAKAPVAIGIFSLLSDYSEVEARVYEEFVQSKHHFYKDHLEIARSSYHRMRPDTINVVKHFAFWAQATKGIGTGFIFSWYGNPGLGPIIVDAYPSTTWPWIYAGKEKPPGEGTTEFKRALALDTSLALPCYLLAATCVEKKDWSGAEEWLREAIRKAKGDEFITLNAHLLSAAVYAHEGSTSQVLHETRIALQMDSTYVVHSLSEGIYGRSERDHQWFLLDKPIGSDSLRSPSDRKLATLLNLWSGWSYYHSGIGKETQKYILFFRKVIELDPQNLDGYLAMASMYSEYRLRDERGILPLQNVLHRYPANGRAHRILGDLYVIRNMVEKAKAEYKTAYELGDFRAKTSLYLLENWKAQ